MIMHREKEDFGLSLISFTKHIHTNYSILFDGLRDVFALVFVDVAVSDWSLGIDVVGSVVVAASDWSESY